MSSRALAALLACGCAPLASLRPAGELGDAGRRYEVGGAYVALGPRPYVIEEWQHTGQLWGTLALGRRLELSGIAAFDETAVAGGAALRWTPLALHRVAAGGELELGYAWTALALPAAVQPVDGVWLYTAPRLGTQGVHLTPAVPLGVSARVLPAVRLRAEAQLSYARFYAYERRWHLALGAAYQW